jgi:hypothetical protein
LIYDTRIKLLEIGNESKTLAQKSYVKIVLKLITFYLQPIFLFIHEGLTFYPTGLEISCQELATG